MSQSIQCHGVTLKGERCKKFSTGSYCHYHTTQAQNSNPLKSGVMKSSPIVRPGKSSSHTPPHLLQNNIKKKSGFIYAYTISDLLSPNTDKSWLQIQDPNNTWKPFKSKKSKVILIKVGMTTKPSVLQRLVQWEQNCDHSITCLNPHIKYFHRSIVDLFTTIKLTNKYETFRDNGFYCSQVALAEAEIHKALRQKFGRRNVLCSACSQKHGGAKYVTHVEWFLVPTKEFDYIFEVIDKVCQKYA